MVLLLFLITSYSIHRMKIITYRKSLFTLAISVLLYVPTLSVAQVSPSIEWQHCIGGTGNEESPVIIATRDGGYVMVAVTYSKDGDVRNAPPTEFNGWVVKLDEFGQIQWSRCVDGDHQSFLNSVIETADGSFVVAGGTASLYFDGTKTHGGTDALVMKLNEDGGIIWQKVFGGSGSDVAYSVVERNREGGGYIFAGFTTSNDGDAIERPPGSGSAWIVEISRDGDIQWQKYLGGSKGESISSILQTTDGGFVFSGTSSSNDGDVVGHKGANENGWIVKLNTSGSIIWQKSFYCTFKIIPNGKQPIVITPDGGITAIGSTSELDSSVQGYHKSNDFFGTLDVYVVHLNSLGTILWERCYGGTENDYGHSICTTSDGGYLFIGSAFSNDGDVSGNHQSNVPSSYKGFDAWVVKLSINGSIEWQKCYGGPANESGSSILQTKDGKILFGAYANSIDGDGDVYGLHSISPDMKNNSDIWVVKLGINAGVTDDSNFDFTGLIRDKFLKIYPNPSSTSVHLEMLPWFTTKGVEIYNLLGTKISCETTIAENGANVNVKSLPNGTYIARVAYTTEKVNGTFTLPLIVYH